MQISFVQSALSGSRLLPPPASGTLVFTDANGARTRLAPYGWIALIVQRVIGNIQRMDHRPDLLGGPFEQRVVFEQPEHFVELARSEEHTYELPSIMRISYA